MAFDSATAAAAAKARHEKERKTKAKRSAAQRQVLDRIEGVAARAEPTPTDPKETLEQVRRVAAGSVDIAAERGDSPDAVAELRKQVEMLTNVIEKMQKGGAPGKVELPQGGQPIVCSVCLQNVKLCKQDHVRMSVLPRDAMNAAGFGGVTINGACYYGTCLVPRIMEDTIRAHIATHESYCLALRSNMGTVMNVSEGSRMAGFVSAAPRM